MSAPLVDFESENVLKAKRDERRKAREVILQKAKDDYDKRERRKELAKQRGEDSWMLPSVNLRLEAEEEKTKSKKHKKEKKKKKKHKKEKKRKHKSKHDKEQSSSSDEDSSDEWVVKGSGESAEPSKPSRQYGVTLPPPAYIGEPPADVQRKDDDDAEEEEASASAGKRDDWLASPFMNATYSRDDMRKEKETEKEQEHEKMSKLSMDAPGQSVRELNPFWKDSGTGLPDEDPSSSRKKATLNSGVGDGGASWLRRSFQRAKEMAEEQGRSIEVVAAERWGSLERYYELLAEAEGTSRPSNRQRGSWNKGRGGRPYDRYRDRRDERSHDTERERPRDSDRYRHQDRYKDRQDSRDMERQDRDKERQDRDRDRHHDRTGNDDQRDRNRGRGGERTSRYSDRGSYKDRPSSSSSFSSSSGRTFMKPSDDDRTSRTSSSLKDYKSMFKKPGDSASSVSQSRGSSSSSPGALPSWKKAFKKPGELSDSGDSWKAAFKKPGELGEDRTGKSEKGSTSAAPAWKKLDPKSSGRKDEESSQSRKRHSSSSSSGGSESSGSSSSSEDEGEGDRRKRSPSPPPPAPPVKVLSESEMNQLGAKIVKAELMGNEALAQKLKNKLEAARQAKASQASARPQSSRPQQTNRSRPKDEQEAPDDEVLLTRTDRSGQSWPLPDRTVPAEVKTGRRKKKQKVATHDESGQRARYFADDDEMNLKSMVQREKMSSAEDQQKLFSRMAAKSMDKLDMDYTLDDMFVSSAAKKESKAQTEERERSKAIAEHHRLAASLSKCHMCVDSPEMKKHLIIALGMKVYLSLPSTKSLTEGHCLIIPMQHSIASTSLDEDVWSEIQIFRKGLTRMFEDQGQDAIFLETCMNPKKQRHMCIECIPIPKETGDLAPIYFKKAIQESESEWMDNKKLIDTRNKGLRKSVPVGFPYFSVDFGLDGGFAHIIEDEQLFPHYFGKEIIGGMLDVEPMLWRRPHRQNFDDQRKKVLQFADLWKPFDWTQKIERK